MLCDFGHSRWIASGRDHRILIAYGTREYTPPELWKGLHSATSIRDVTPADPFKADVFALGILLYTLCHGPGRLPTALKYTVHSSLWTYNQLIMHGGSYPLRDARPDVIGDSALMDLLRGMLTVDPAKRYSMGDVIKHPWVLGAGLSY